MRTLLYVFKYPTKLTTKLLFSQLLLSSSPQLLLSSSPQLLLSSPPLLKPAKPPNF